MKSSQINKSWLGLVVTFACLGVFLGGCSNPDGEGLSDQQKLDGAHKAREQQMAGQKPETPMTRDSLPGQNKP